MRKLRLQGDAHSTQAFFARVFGGSNEKNPNPTAKFWERLRSLVEKPHLITFNIHEDFPGGNHFITSKMPKMCGAQRHSEPMTLEAVN